MLEGKTVLVTGGTGSIGFELVKEVLRRGAEKVVIFSRDEIKHFILRKKLGDPRVVTVVGDVREKESIEKIFRRYRIDIVYHTAAMKHVVICEDFPLEAVKTNILGTHNVVEACLDHGVPRMITISTDKAVHPVNVMGATKFIAERITLNAQKAAGKDQVFACVRFGNVANSRGSVIPVFVQNLKDRKPLEITDRNVTRFIMRIKDAVKLIVKATGIAKGGEIFILKMKAFRLGDLVDVMVNKIAPLLSVENVEVKEVGLSPGEKLHEELVNSIERGKAVEKEDMYVVMPDGEGAKEISYTSKDVDFLSQEELEEVVKEYIKEGG